MTYIKLTINPSTASRRTRKCIKNAGHFFELVKEGDLSGIRCDSILVRSVATGWFGWLPLGELIVHSKFQAPDKITSSSAPG